MGGIERAKIMEAFEKVPWAELLEKMASANEKDIHYSPSLEIENVDNQNGICVSAIDSEEWYIFFKRPKLVKKFFGLNTKMDANYVTDLTGQTIEDARTCLEALMKNDLMFLEEKIK